MGIPSKKRKYGFWDIADLACSVAVLLGILSLPLLWIILLFCRVESKDTPSKNTPITPKNYKKELSLGREPSTQKRPNK